jgi:hypothetical protein
MVFCLLLIWFIESMVGGLKYNSSTCAVDESLRSSYEDPAPIVQDPNEDLTLVSFWSGTNDFMSDLRNCRVTFLKLSWQEKMS